MDSEQGGAPAADSQADLAVVPLVRPVEDFAADSAERAEAPAAYPVADSQAESVLVLLAHPAGDAATDSQGRAAGSRAAAVEQAGVPEGLRAAAAAAQELWVPEVNPSAESSVDLVVGPVVDWSDRMTMQLKSRQRQSAVFEDSASSHYSFSLRIIPVQSTYQGKALRQAPPLLKFLKWPGRFTQ